MTEFAFTEDPNDLRCPRCNTLLRPMEHSEVELLPYFHMRKGGSLYYATPAILDYAVCFECPRCVTS